MSVREKIVARPLVGDEFRLPPEPQTVGRKKTPRVIPGKGRKETDVEDVLTLNLYADKLDRGHRDQCFNFGMMEKPKVKYFSDDISLTKINVKLNFLKIIVYDLVCDMRDITCLSSTPKKASLLPCSCIL